jgi:hypothetical protein
MSKDDTETEKQDYLKKPHFFEVVLNSTSDIPDEVLAEFPGGIYLNQELILREYAFTSPELTAKEMQFSKIVIPAMLQAMDEMSKPLQDEGEAQMQAVFEMMKRTDSKGG